MTALSALNTSKNLETFLGELKRSHSRPRHQLAKLGKQLWETQPIPKPAIEALRVVLVKFEASHSSGIFQLPNAFPGFTVGLSPLTETSVLVLFQSVAESVGDCEIAMLGAILKERNFEAMLLKKLLTGEQLHENEVYSYEDFKSAHDSIQQLPHDDKLALALHDYMSDQSQVSFVATFNKLLSFRKAANPRRTAAKQEKDCMACLRAEGKTLSTMGCGHDVCETCCRRGREVHQASNIPKVPLCPVPGCLYVLSKLERHTLSYPTAPRAYFPQPEVRHSVYTFYS